MPSQFNVAIHESQFPARVQDTLNESLRARRINPKFHYESRRQARKWLALHEAHSPARTDANVRQTYDQAFDFLSQQIKGEQIQIIGLGCGGGHKEANLILRLLRARDSVSFTAVDVSPSLVLASLIKVQSMMPEGRCIARNLMAPGFVCDFGHDLDPFPGIADLALHEATHVYTFFGMMPNFEPGIVLGRLGHLLRGDDFLLVSANLAPGEDYGSGVRRVLPQYDNALTCDWLLTLLVDLGLNQGDGFLEWRVESCPLESDLRRVAAHYQFARKTKLGTESAEFTFEDGDRLGLFFSYRYTADRLREILSRHELKLDEEWICPSGEEGVFLARRSKPRPTYPRPL